ncbi:ATP-dependent metalloprotease FtsH [Acidimicrobium ferrooxidans DSM 10331]|uniref:ATP-dependent zinc metalloprotease FtsH n=1 Tax=Acidimicrobium ferrooxidans (strain DSM 10331 / JCM 15462 / NBRC 103882 / ICP) TaxID=525909 RepID=FTSH_ACIFD|nr:ATP-dependent zinc metalloprotease FtsH [Acidimicrobium ferrooxidans]C7M0M0.1 RecName: Full=ATP-dependent zinc metalloprotease FtsH [Acidimicrobium ferrooxidans DSM 10331]ACU54528.1 ATP-dependent metalloprotease FtsH [Acidimicrobium ferrooxidans DSM 10331]
MMPSSQRPSPRGSRQSPSPDQRGRIAFAILATLVVAVLLLTLFSHAPSGQPLGYSTFIHDVQAKQVRTAVLNNTTGQITGSLTNGTAYSVTGPLPYTSSELSTLSKAHVQVSYITPGPGIASTIIEYVIFFGIFIGIWVYLTRRTQGSVNGIMSVGRSRAKTYTTERPKTTFDDVAGYQGVKGEVKEVVDFLRDPSRFSQLGARIPKGILLVGPPGTGKTLLARAVAGEAGVPFMSVSGSDFMEMFVGVGAARVRDLFQTARRQSPSIIFIDEIDSIGRKRGTGLGGGHDEREQTLNQMLSEMDGFDPAEGIVVMAATNRPDILDPALLRPGRFDRQIVVPLPDLPERLAILQVHTRGKRLAPDVDLEVMAKGTPGMSGADLANLVNEAALNAVRRGATDIAMADFDSARDRIIMGQRREATILSDEEKERVAFHEGGHAVLAYVLDYSDPVHKVTILPTGMALGVTQQLPERDRHLYPREYIEDTLVVRMGGRVAELLVYGDLSTGAANDLQGNTELARRMVREWGMSERLGPMAWGSQNVVFLGEDLLHSAEYSDRTARLVDEEVERILREQEERATELLRQHLPGLIAVAHALLERETISGEEVGRLVDEAAGHPIHPDGKRVLPIAKLPEYAELEQFTVTNGNNHAASHDDTDPVS